MTVYTHNGYDQSAKDKYPTKYCGFNFKVECVDGRFYVYTFWNDTNEQRGEPSKHKSLELAKQRVKYMSQFGYRT